MPKIVSSALIASLLCLPGLWAQNDSNHVQWTLELSPSPAAPGAEVLGKLTGTIDSGWHLYSITTPPGPIPTTIRLADSPAVASLTVYQPKPERKFDPNFNADTETYTDKVTFLLKIKLASSASGDLTLTAKPRYQVCSSNQCIPPVTKEITGTLQVAAGTPAAAVAIPSGYSEARPRNPSSSTGSSDSDGSLLGFLGVAFGVGLASIFTPCVFPMIPITMSFFLNKQGASKAAIITQAAIFCVGIIVLFTAMGLIVTAILGPFGVVQLGSNVWVNGIIACVFLAFGLSLLGAFEINLPSGLLTTLNQKSEQGGTLGTLLMGLTFALASFACVGPFMGTLLAASVQSGGPRPVLGMIFFASGLALPFFLLALFPQYLKKMPRSGGWLARVKVVMGFIVLAAMFKYIAAIDQVMQWNAVTRERFLAVWVVLFAMAGLYLLAFLPLEGVKRDDKIGMGRLLTGIAFLAFALSLIPGMFGSHLGELETFVPPPAGNSAFGAGGGQTTLAWMKNDLAGALDRARREKKLVLVNFTGYACTNCHWMKANMFTRPEIAGVMKDMVLVDLYTDGEDAESQANQALENGEFHTIAIPFYVIYDPDKKVVATFPSQTRDAARYLAFLNTRPAEGQPAQTAATADSGAPALPFKTLDGADFDASSLSGKVLVVNFWATWCVPCRKEIPGFNRMNKELAPQGVAVIGVSLDEDGAEVVKPFLSKNPMDYPVALGSDAAKDKYQIGPLPTTIVMDRQGKIVHKFEGLTSPEDIQKAVKQAL
jgi:thiol:disulfide interchange protein DsbD